MLNNSDCRSFTLGFHKTDFAQISTACAASILWVDGHDIVSNIDIKLNSFVNFDEYVNIKLEHTTPI